MSDDSKCCDCVDEIANKLKDFEGFVVNIFEGNEAFVEGIIRDVIDGEVVRLENAFKFIFTPSSGTNFFGTYNELFISICEISQFAPLFEANGAGVAAQIATRRNNLIQNTKAIRMN